ncbi:hypothetical protein CIL05_04305 [Virgibacillus profundi]|uniref:Uncharacterized protein n=1 Tax=Virgibacillus profundi TaxID=2024555 RepID=A0A2A2IIN4_9BACI|nr:hypothetical protein [Virgibacillus profundi]PAV30943.1 hypothetical protein CIL05_04305 [Virgibacillus profundi]PXY55128.1 hypothetical protein CIT14_04390 [Virgibacillus profundi]
MTRKIYYFGLVILIILLAACSSDSSNEETPVAEETSNAEAPLEPEVLFSYEEGEDDRYEIHNITSSYDASTVLFNTKETIKRDDERYDYVVYGGKDAVELRELSTSGDEEEACQQENISPNGQYLIVKCLKMDHAFMIYDLEKDEIIHEEPEFEDYGTDVMGITNDMEVVLKSIDGDLLSIYNVENKQTEEYSLPKLTGIEDEVFENFAISNDGQKILINAFYRLYLVDRGTGELQEILNLDSYQEQFETEELYLYSQRFSPDGKYAFIKISENTSDPIYQSHNFINLETGEIQSFSEFEYNRIGDIDENGRVLLTDSDDEIYIYSIPDEETYRIPDLDLSTYADEFTLSTDGNYLLYSDKKSDEVKTNYVYKVALGDVSTYETTDFMATPEELEELESSPGEGDTTADSIELSPVEEDVNNLYMENWNNISNVLYPTEFPEEVESISYRVNTGRYGQTIKFVSDSTVRKDMSFTAVDRTGEDHPAVCIDDDLELTETKDGIDYYFYLFSNDEGEISFVKDEWCYTIEGEDFTEEEYFTVAYSLAKAGEIPHELPIDEVSFPTELPIQDVIVSRNALYHYDEMKHKYVVDYYGDNENDVKIDFEIDQNEPDFYDYEENESIELTNGMEGSYNEEYLRVFMYDDKYYYTIKADIDNELIDKLGIENIKNALIEVGNSVE